MIDTNYNLVIRLLKKLLDKLGRDKYEVADTLRAENIKGKRNMCGACPVAVYVAKKSNDEFELIHAYAYSLSAFRKGKCYTVTLPRAAVNFIQDFDDGMSCFADLLEK